MVLDSRPSPSVRRSILVCQPCRALKKSCDKTKPSCIRCSERQITCVYAEAGPKPHVQQQHHELSIAADTPGENSRDGVPSLRSNTLSDTVQACEILSSLTHDVSASAYCTPYSTANSRSTGRRETVTRKRDRKRTSCIRCQRLKSRCDRQNSCAGCVKSKEKCEYGHFTGRRIHEIRQQPENVPETDSCATSTWKAPYYPSLHWMHILDCAMNLLSAINTEGERDSPGSTRWKYSSHHEHQPIPPNYPFGSNGTDQNQSTTFLSTISRPIVEHLAEQYLNTTEKVYRLLHVPTFKAELQLYWDRRPEQVNDDGWMAQLCMILYLGYESLRSTTDMNAGHHFGASRQHSSFSTNLLNGTSAYLNRTPFLARPTVCTIRVLALIMLARQVSRFSCAQEDASWSLTGTIVRIAMNLGLHDEASYAILPPLQAEIRRSLWITVLCLDLRQSLLSGMPAMIVPQQFTCAVPANLDLDSIMPFFDGPLAEHDGDVRTTATFRIRFHQMLPLVCEIASAAHSTYCTYASAVAHDAQVQELLKHISNTRKHDAHNRATAGRFLEGIAYDKIDWVNIQLDILLRRLLLSVHRKFAYRSDAHTRYPVSYWSTIDCASALLVYQQQMLCHTSEVSQSDRWIAGFFRLDFFVAALTLSICLVNDKGGLHPDAARGRDARQTLKETLRSCRDLWAEETHLSICHEHISKFIERVVSTF